LRGKTVTTSDYTHSTDSSLLVMSVMPSSFHNVIQFHKLYLNIFTSNPGHLQNYRA